MSEIAAMLSPGDEMFVITFNSRAVLRQKFTSSAEEIQRALVGVRAGGETALYDAISLGLDELKAAKNRKQILVLLTDGFDTRSKITAAEAEESLTKSDALVYAIGIDDDDNDPRSHSETHRFCPRFSKRWEGVSPNRRELKKVIRLVECRQLGV